MFERSVIFFLNWKSKRVRPVLFSVRARVDSVAKSGGDRASPPAVAARRASYQPRPRATETEHAADMATTRMDWWFSRGKLIPPTHSCQGRSIMTLSKLSRLFLCTGKNNLNRNNYMKIKNSYWIKVQSYFVTITQVSDDRNNKLLYHELPGYLAVRYHANVIGWLK